MSWAPAPWAEPPAWPSHPRDGVHVWGVDLSAPLQDVDRLESTLVPAEFQRAARQRCPLNRARFVARRGALRTILSRYLRVAPGEVPLETTPAGKPFIRPAANPDGIQFNLSQSGELAVVAVAGDRSVGVDVERVRGDFPLRALISEALSLRERAALAALPSSLWRRALFAAWARKEAVLKARGDGLRFPPAAVEVSLDPSPDAQLLAAAGERDSGSRWWLRGLPVGSAYAAAVALEAPSACITCWRWAATP